MHVWTIAVRNDSFILCSTINLISYYAKARDFINITPLYFDTHLYCNDVRIVVDVTLDAYGVKRHASLQQRHSRV